MLHNSDRAWMAWGKTDPYFGVVTNEKFRKSNLNAESLEEFFRSGEDHVASIFSKVSQNLKCEVTPFRALDFGCGTARTLIPLAKRCEYVVGVDVSEDMLVEARRNCVNRNCGNVEFYNIRDGVRLRDLNYDFVHSYIVFQHIPVKKGEKITSELLAGLSHGGFAVLHYSTVKVGSVWRRWLSRMRRVVPGIHNFANIVEGRIISEPLMQMNEYDLGRILAIFSVNGFRSVHCDFTLHSGYHGVTVFGEKVEG